MTRGLLGLAALMCLTPLLTAQEKLPNDSPYYPLKVGNTWEYKSENKTITVTVERYEKIGDELCARLVSRVTGAKDDKPKSEHIAVRKEEGIFRTAYQDTPMTPPLCFLKLDANNESKGEWPVETRMFNVALKGKGEVSKVEKIKVNGVDYDTLPVTLTLTADKNSIKVIYYFAKDVGIVKQVSEINNKATTLELVKFTAGK